MDELTPRQLELIQEEINQEVLVLSGGVPITCPFCGGQHHHTAFRLMIARPRIRAVVVCDGPCPSVAPDNIIPIHVWDFDVPSSA